MGMASAYAQKAMLDWVLLGATPTRPTQIWMGLSYGSPDATSASEIVTPAGTYTRVTVTFAAGATSGGVVTASNAAAVIFPVCSWSATVSGYQLWDTQAVGSGNMLGFGLLDVATRPATASQFTAANGSVKMTCL